MSETNQTAEPQTVKISIELEMPLKPGKTISDVIAAAKEVLTESQKHGNASRFLRRRVTSSSVGISFHFNENRFRVSSPDRTAA